MGIHWQLGHLAPADAKPPHWVISPRPARDAHAPPVPALGPARAPHDTVLSDWPGDHRAVAARASLGIASVLMTARVVPCDVELADARDLGRVGGCWVPKIRRWLTGCCVAALRLEHGLSPRLPASNPLRVARAPWPRSTAGLARRPALALRAGMPDGYRTVIGRSACVASALDRRGEAGEASRTRTHQKWEGRG